MGTMDLLAYTSDPLSESVRDAAGNAAAQCGFDQWAEVLLHHEILSVRRVSAQSVKEAYPGCSCVTNEPVHIDWQIWPEALMRGG